MNREIKFRAWSWKDKFMHTVSELIWMAGGMRFYGPGVGEGENMTGKEDEFVLMEFTGLKDKNGKEIYDGDIIKIQYVGSEGIKVVKYNLDYRFSGFGFLENLNTGEVIGNIYENPELINSNK